MTLDEILAGLKEHIGDDKAKEKAVADALQKDVNGLATVLISRGAGAKTREIEGRVKVAEDARDAAIAERDAVTTEFSEFKAKTPDVAAAVEKERAKWEPKVKAAQDEAKAAKESATQSRVKSATDRFVAEMVAKGVDKDYARYTLAPKYADRITIGEDGAEKVLQLGSSDPYAPGADTTAEALLAADVVKGVDPRFMVATGDSGSGITNGNAPSNGGSYDPVKAGLALAEREKGTTAGAASALR